MRNPEHRSVLSLMTVLFLALLTVSTATWAQSEARVYELNNRTADDIALQIRELYQQSPVTVTARGQQLVVRGEPALLDEIGTLVQSMDVPPVQMRISVRYRQDIGGKQSGGGVSLSNGSAGASVERRTISTNSTRERQLIVQDGQSAHITRQCATLPFAVKGGLPRHTAAGRNPKRLCRKPQAISSQAVELSIVSFEEDPAALPATKPALMTIRRVEPGQWVSLGGTLHLHESGAARHHLPCERQACRTCPSTSKWKFCPDQA